MFFIQCDGKRAFNVKREGAVILHDSIITVKADEKNIAAEDEVYKKLHIAQLERASNSEPQSWECECADNRKNKNNDISKANGTLHFIRQIII